MWIVYKVIHTSKIRVVAYSAIGDNLICIDWWCNMSPTPRSLIQSILSIATIFALGIGNIIFIQKFSLVFISFLFFKTLICLRILIWITLTLTIIPYVFSRVVQSIIYIILRISTHKEAIHITLFYLSILLLIIILRIIGWLRRSNSVGIITWICFLITLR